MDGLIRTDSFNIDKGFFHQFNRLVIWTIFHQFRVTDLTEILITQKVVFCSWKIHFTRFEKKSFDFETRRSELLEVSFCKNYFYPICKCDKILYFRKGLTTNLGNKLLVIIIIILMLVQHLPELITILWLPKESTNATENQVWYSL